MAFVQLMYIDPYPYLYPHTSMCDVCVCHITIQSVFPYTTNCPRSILMSPFTRMYNILHIFLCFLLCFSDLFFLTLPRCHIVLLFLYSVFPSCFLLRCDVAILGCASFYRNLSIGLLCYIKSTLFLIKD